MTWYRYTEQDGTVVYECEGDNCGYKITVSRYVMREGPKWAGEEIARKQAQHDREAQA